MDCTMTASGLDRYFKPVKPLEDLGGMVLMIAGKKTLASYNLVVTIS